MVRTTGAQTRERIRVAAAELFRAHGYAGTSVRDIASRANADPALIIRHFGSKESLFLDTVHAPLSSAPHLSVPLEQLGRHFIAFLLDDADDQRRAFLALVRGSHEPSIAHRLRSAHELTFVGPIRSRLTGEDAELRARLAAALVGGLLYSMWVVEDEQLLAADHALIAEQYGALLQSILTPEG